MGTWLSPVSILFRFSRGCLSPPRQRLQSGSAHSLLRSNVFSPLLCSDPLSWCINSWTASCRSQQYSNRPYVLIEHLTTQRCDAVSECREPFRITLLFGGLG